jgi:hypothetical protein
LDEKKQPMADAIGRTMIRGIFLAALPKRGRGRFSLKQINIKMIKKELINEAMEYLKNDCSYAAIVGTIEYGDIDPNVFKREPVEEQSFDHVYMVAHAMGNTEDYYSGKCLIPFAEFQYLVCEWAS